MSQMALIISIGARYRRHGECAAAAQVPSALAGITTSSPATAFSYISPLEVASILCFNVFRATLLSRIAKRR